MHGIYVMYSMVYINNQLVAIEGCQCCFVYSLECLYIWYASLQWLVYIKISLYLNISAALKGRIDPWEMEHGSTSSLVSYQTWEKDEKQIWSLRWKKEKKCMYCCWIPIGITWHKSWSFRYRLGISVYFFVEQFPFQDPPKHMGMPRFSQVIFAWTHQFAPHPPLQVRKTHLDRVEVVGGIAAGIHKEGLEKFSSKQWNIVKQQGQN